MTSKVVAVNCRSRKTAMLLGCMKAEMLEQCMYMKAGMLKNVYEGLVF